MINEEFVKKIKLYVRDSALKGTVRQLTKPSGRSPKPISIKKSEFYNNLNDKEKEVLTCIIKDSIDLSLFNFLTILDCVSFIDDEAEKPNYELYRVTSEKKELINNPDEEYLHDIFNSLVQEEE